MQVRIFRFDAKKDILGYFKPYFFDNFVFKTLKNLLEKVKEIDPYFDFDNKTSVKINGVVTPINLEFDKIVNRFGNELEISPLSTKRAIKDLIINDGDFWAKFEPFKNICNNSDKATYAELKPYFYASFIQKYEPNFVGNSAIIFTKYLCEKYPEKKSDILKIINDKQYGVWIACTIKNDIFWNDFEFEEALKFAKENLQKPKTPEPKMINFIDCNNLATKNLNGFSVAIYGDESKFKMQNVKIIKTKNLPCGYEFLGLNDELALRLAGEILFDAFDNGADFLLTFNEKEFYMFDTLSKEISKIFNRDLCDFYILHISELNALLCEQIPQSLKEHKLKVKCI